MFGHGAMSRFERHVGLLSGQQLAGLAVAAVGFHELHTWLPRVALLLPVLLLLASLARPDSQEALAMRLHEVSIGRWKFLMVDG